MYIFPLQTCLFRRLFTANDTHLCGYNLQQRNKTRREKIYISKRRQKIDLTILLVHDFTGEGNQSTRLAIKLQASARVHSYACIYKQKSFMIAKWTNRLTFKESWTTRFKVMQHKPKNMMVHHGWHFNSPPKKNKKNLMHQFEKRWCTTIRSWSKNVEISSISL